MLSMQMLTTIGSELHRGGGGRNKNIIKYLRKYLESDKALFFLQFDRPPECDSNDRHVPQTSKGCGGGGVPLYPEIQADRLCFFVFF